MNVMRAWFKDRAVEKGYRDLGVHTVRMANTARTERSSQRPERALLFDSSIDSWAMSGNWNNLL